MPTGPAVLKSPFLSENAKSLIPSFESSRVAGRQSCASGRREQHAIAAKCVVRKLAFFVVSCLLAMQLCASIASAQSAGTGAIAGTVTDSSGAAVTGAKVTLTSLATGQTRSASTGANGDYRFSLLPPGNYKLDFSASGFKTASVPSVAVVTTETATVNQTLEVGSVTQTVTVESNAQVLQTESATLGGTVSGAQINALPMANGNYTEILSLSPGTSVAVDNATALGKGTQDISANGVDPGSNNFQMDGVAVDNIANSGSANDGTIYTGIPIPSTDAIQEFKVQTSTYDASYGRNPGANVVVNTKSGTNQFHGSAFEYLRNSVLNADDFFYTKTAAEPHQVLDQNQFGATLGGPIKKDKLFFFFSYRGTRGKNGVAPQGETFGALLPTALNPYAALGSRGTCNTPAAVPDYGSIASECDATAQAFASNVGITNVVGLRLFQLTTGKGAGVPNNYYIPAPASDPQFCAGGGPVCNFTVPAIYSENQYVANGDWDINSKQTFTTKYFYTANPQTLYLGQAGGDLPGTPEYTPWGNQAAQARLTSLVTNNFVNVARISYQRNNAGADVAVPPGGCPNAGHLTGLTGCGSPSQLGMQPLVPGFYEPPSIIDIFDNFSLFGGLLPFHGPTNQIQLADEISWQHGRHSIRAGYEYEWTNWPLQDQGLQQGLLLTAGALPGPTIPPGFSAGLATGGNAGPLWDVGCLFCVKGITGENGIIHFYHLDNQAAYVLDDFKVNSKLTVNIGLRWEFDGLLTDSLGRLTQVWLSRMVDNSAVPTCDPTVCAANPALGVQQYVVPSNFEKFFGPPPAGVGVADNKYSIQGHAPYSNFAPRFGFAWQPLSSKLVIRGGFGIFYDRVGLDSVVHAYEQGYPYAATYDYSTGSSRWALATLAQPYPQISLVCMPSDPNCNSDFGLGFAPRFADPATANSPAPVNSSLSTPFDPNSVHTPLVREYSLGAQYEFEPGWVLNVGYVGSSGINLLDYNHNHNQATLATPTNQFSYLCAGTICNTSANAQFRVPYLGYAPDGLAASDDNGYSNYNSLQVSVQHQFSHGLTIQAAYTWDKNLTDVFFGPSANINNALCMMCQYGRASFDRPQRFVMNYSYDLPFEKNQQGFVGHVLGGWNVSGITIAQSGDPLTLISSNNAGGAYGTNTTSYLTGVTTAQYCSGFNNGNIVRSGSILSRIASGYFNTAGFCTAPIVPFGDATATGFGDSGVGVVLGPGQFNWDISLLKNNKLTERVNMQFRADFYNAFNHPQFADPGGGGFATVGFVDIDSAATSSITHTNVNPRLIQLGLHFFF